MILKKVQAVGLGHPTNTMQGKEGSFHMTYSISLHSAGKDSQQHH